MNAPGLHYTTAAMLQFLKTEIEAGVTFAAIAGTKLSPEKRQWYVAEARKAYDIVLRMTSRVSLGAEEATSLHNRLRVLKTALEQLGERC